MSSKKKQRIQSEATKAPKVGGEKPKPATPKGNAPPATKNATKEIKEPEATTAATAAAALHNVAKPVTPAKGEQKNAPKSSKKVSNSTRSKPKKVPVANQQQQPLNSENTTETPELEQATKSEGEAKDIKASDEHREKAAVKIQAVFRGHKDRRQFIQKRKDAIKVEAVARGFLTRKRVTQMKANSTPAPVSATAAEVPSQNTATDQDKVPDADKENSIPSSNRIQE